MHVSYAYLVRATGLPTFEVLRHSRVLSFFGRLAASECDLTYSALGLSWGCKGSWSCCLVRALLWLQPKCESLRNVASPALGTLLEWAEVVRVLGVGEFKTLVKKAVKSSRITEDLTPDGNGDQAEAAHNIPDEEQTLVPGEPDEIAFNCKECGKACASRAGLVNHLRACHGISESVADRVTGNVCQQCGGRYGSRSALIAHLRAHIAPICRAHYQALPRVPHPQAAVQPTFRTQFTRRGRKRREGGVPKSDMVIPILLDPEHVDSTGQGGV
eukprot:5964686-Amphidinium_carterae.2